MSEGEVGLDCVVEETVGNSGASERAKKLRQDVARYFFPGTLAEGRLHERDSGIQVGVGGVGGDEDSREHADRPGEDTNVGGHAVVCGILGEYRR